MSQPQMKITMELVGMDFDALEKKFEEAIEEGMTQMKDEIEKVWRDKAAQTLHSSKDKYLQGLSVEMVGKDTVQATLTGFLPVGIEEGHERYDMKPGTLGNAVSKVIPIGKSAGKTPAFRTMKTDSPGWMHPGWQAKKIHVQVQKEIDENLNSQIFAPLISRISL